MARKWRDSDNVDPFNAGDPLMPGDDDSAWHDSEECEFDEGAYEAPKTKKARLTENFKRQVSPVDEEISEEEPAPRAASVNNGPSPAQEQRSKKVLKWVILFIVIVSLGTSIMGLVVSCAIGIGENIGYVASEIFGEDDYYDDYDYFDDYDDDYDYSDDYDDDYDYFDEDLDYEDYDDFEFSDDPDLYEDTKEGESSEGSNSSENSLGNLRQHA